MVPVDVLEAWDDEVGFFAPKEMFFSKMEHLHEGQGQKPGQSKAF